MNSWLSSSIKGARWKKGGRKQPIRIELRSLISTNANARLTVCQGHSDTPCMVFEIESLKYGAKALYIYVSNFNDSSIHVTNEV